MKGSKQWFAAAGLALWLAAVVAGGAAQAAGKQAAAARPWWTHATIYEIYVRSFQDTNGDGIGDLKGTTSRLDYLKSLGVDALWLTPFYPSPNADFGYDISDYTGIAPEYGTTADWDALVREARQRGIRLLVDFVVNHSSDQHPWFKESRSSRDNPKRDWYVWRDGKPGNQPPSNWQSIFGGPTWTHDAATKQWYYHIFMDKQPDLSATTRSCRAPTRRCANCAASSTATRATRCCSASRPPRASRSCSRSTASTMTRSTCRWISSTATS
jgi:alpha-glucosidase